MYALLGIAYDPSSESIRAAVFITISCSPLLAAGFLPTSSNNPPKPNKILINTLTLLGFLNLAVVAKSSGQSITDLTNIEGIIKIASSSTHLRYTEHGSSGNPILTTCTFYSLFLIGRSSSMITIVNRGIGFLPSILYTIITTEKYPLFVGIAFYATGLFVYTPKKAAIRRTLSHATAFIILGTTIGLTALITRSGTATAGPEKLLHYILAPYPALGSWIDSKEASADPKLGKFTFIGPLDAIGVTKRQSGVFEENVEIHGQDTNIMTAWKYLILDFSLLGPLIASTIAAMAFTISNRLKQKTISETILIGVIFSALLSLNATPFTHNSVALALIISQTTHLLKLVKNTQQEKANEFRRTSHI